MLISFRRPVRCANLLAPSRRAYDAIKRDQRERRVQVGRLKLYKMLVETIDLKLGHRPLW
jgi:hypothetical protein